MRLQDMQTATVLLYSATPSQLITLGHGYSGDTTLQNGTTTLTMFSTAGETRHDDSTLLTPRKTSLATPSH
jgi:hypothetical protein